jgi:putative acetyltransferase
MKYRSIFHNDDYSFNELQVVKLVEKYQMPEIIENIWVYDDGIVKGMIHIEEKEIVELYVDYFFWNQGIGAKLVEKYEGSLNNNIGLPTERLEEIIGEINGMEN